MAKNQNRGQADGRYQYAQQKIGVLGTRLEDGKRVRMLLCTFFLPAFFLGLAHHRRGHARCVLGRGFTRIGIDVQLRCILIRGVFLHRRERYRVKRGSFIEVIGLGHAVPPC